MMSDFDVVEKLTQYIELLLKLSASGFKCEREMKIAVMALHEAMGFKNTVKITG